MSKTFQSVGPQSCAVPATVLAASASTEVSLTRCRTSRPATKAGQKSDGRPVLEALTSAGTATANAGSTKGRRLAITQRLTSKEEGRPAVSET